MDNLGSKVKITHLLWLTAVSQNYSNSFLDKMEAQKIAIKYKSKRNATTSTLPFA